MKTRDCDLLFCDVETGGLSPINHDILEVAAIRTDPTGARVIEEWSSRVFPMKPVDPKAAEVNGYGPAAWADTAIPIGAAMDKLSVMSKDAVFVAHNAAFDFSFIEAAGVRWDGSYHKMDTVALAMPLLKRGLVDKVNLQALVAFFGIDPGEPHRALSDARACREVYLRIMKWWDLAFGAADVK